jgi:hypothetical protein
MNIGQTDAKASVKPMVAAPRGKQTSVVIPIQVFTERIERFCKLLAEITKQAGGVCQ